MSNVNSWKEKHNDPLKVKDAKNFADNDLEIIIKEEVETDDIIDSKSNMIGVYNVIPLADEDNYLKKHFWVKWRFDDL